MLVDRIKPFGEEVHLPTPSKEAGGRSIKAFSIDVADFKRLLQSEGFGSILLNGCGSETFVTVEVIGNELVEEFYYIGDRQPTVEH